ncbi:MAG TPA: hypothetical protein VND65_09330, partial [Candidatus Binatia bacterium]|nr:hypothetical protein [Candidatus Binatia bacterium]
CGFNGGLGVARMEWPSRVYKLTVNKVFQATITSAQRAFHVARFRSDTANCQMRRKTGSRGQESVSQQTWNWPELFLVLSKFRDTPAAQCAAVPVCALNQLWILQTRCSQEDRDWPRRFTVDSRSLFLCSCPTALKGRTQPGKERQSVNVVQAEDSSRAPTFQCAGETQSGTARLAPLLFVGNEIESGASPKSCNLLYIGVVTRDARPMSYDA